MFYKIIDIKTVADNGSLFVLVHFWRTKKDFTDGAQPYLINDFILGVKPLLVVYKRDINGDFITKSGKKVKEDDQEKNKKDKKDPFLQEVIENDIPKFVERSILRFIERAVEKNYTGDKTAMLRLSNNDHYKTKEKVLHLRGGTKDVNI